MTVTFQLRSYKFWYFLFPIEYFERIYFQGLYKFVEVFVCKNFYRINWKGTVSLGETGFE